MTDVVVSESITLDGVMQDPTGEEGLPGGGWFLRVRDDARAAWADTALTEALQASALLMGRMTYEFFASRWPSRSGPLADRLNTMPKFVATRSATGLDWAASTAVHGDAEALVAASRRAASGDVLVYGSRRLVHALLAADLVDELRLTIFPHVTGSGERLFPDAGKPASLLLARATTLGAELPHLVYRRR